MADDAKAAAAAEKKAIAEAKAATALPPYVASREVVYERLQAKFVGALAAKEKPPITVSVNGVAVDGCEAWETSPFEAAQKAGLDAAVLEGALVARVTGHEQRSSPGNLWDLARPLEESCEVTLLDFETDAGKQVFWHSTAHILGSAMEEVYGGELTIGPPLEDGGFYYDMHTPEGVSAKAEDFKLLEKKMKQIVKKKNTMQERIEVTPEEAVEIFSYNKYKCELVTRKKSGGETSTKDHISVYRCGKLIDLCQGPHVPNTKLVKALALNKVGSAYWLGDADNDSLQRVYGISFPDHERLKQWKFRMAEAAKRDHRKIGKDQELFFFHPLSPGSCFFQPHGARLYNTLMNFIKQQYWVRGYDEVMSPNQFNLQLWEVSGHAAHYKEDMFLFGVEGQCFGLKPMNCPGHCLMFKERIRSHRELPMRYADFGVLHRNELSGALSGLTRVRRFQQDDSHIFCRPDQVRAEVQGVLDFIRYVYDIFGMGFELMLSTRPEKYLGEIAVWDAAETDLAAALDAFCKDVPGKKAGTNLTWGVNAGDGAFYGPKIDIRVEDALGRKHQCATVQLDFQLPIRFDLQYQSETGSLERPIIVHRAVLGSVERMIAVLTEHYGGKWPFWLSPRQALVIPVAAKYVGYATKVKDAMKGSGFYCEVETSARTLNKMIREAQLSQVNDIIVVGENEETANTVTVRDRDAEGREQTVLPLADYIAKCVDKIREHK